MTCEVDVFNSDFLALEVMRLEFFWAYLSKVFDGLLMILVGAEKSKVPGQLLLVGLSAMFFKKLLVLMLMVTKCILMVVMLQMLFLLA